MNTEENTNEINEMLEDSHLKEVIIEESAPDGIFDRFKNSEVGKAVFGEDGKFDMEDVERLAESAKSAVRCRKQVERSYPSGSHRGTGS